MFIEEYREERCKEVFLFLLIIIMFCMLVVVNPLKAVIFTGPLVLFVCLLSARKVKNDKRMLLPTACTKEDWHGSF